MERAGDISSSSPLPGLNLFAVVSLLGLLIAILLIRRGRRSNKGEKGLHSIPGPRQYFLGNWLNLWELCDYKKAIKIGRKWASEVHGSVMSLHVGPFKGFVLLTPEAIQKIWGSGDVRLAEKSFLYSYLKMVGWYDGVIMSKGEKWKSRRKLIVSKLSYGNLRGYIEPINECSRTLVASLEERFQPVGVGGEPRPIDDLLFDSTFRTLCRALFGIQNDEEYKAYDCDGFIRSTHRYLEIVVYRTSHPWLASDLLFRLHPMSKELSAYYMGSRKLIETLAEDIVRAEREGTCKKKPSLMKHLVEAGLSLDAIYEEVETTFVGGYETTGNALHYLFFLLALNPDHQLLCQEEVDSLFEDDELCPDGDISLAGLKRLNYLEQCVLEAMRILPPPVGFLRDLGASVTLDDGIQLPAGTTVAVGPLAIHMNPRYYPNPETFDPSRFSPEERGKRSPYAYLPFSAGPRGCLAFKFAMNEMLITAAHVLRHFQVDTVDRLEDVVFLPNIAMTPETPMKFLFTKRQVL